MRTTPIIMAAALLLLTGCGRAEQVNAPAETTAETVLETAETAVTTSGTTVSTAVTSTAVTETETETAAETTQASAAAAAKAEPPAEPATTAAAEPQSNADIYMQILDTLWNEGTFPDGSEAEVMGELTENEFAVYDIDGDGRDELLLSFVSSSMAGMQFHIWDADENGNVYEELGVFPAVTFYDNGAVTVEASHNQGYAGEFWPYTLLQYDPGTDAYMLVLSVDAMDRNLLTSMEQLDLYPEEADTSGTGFVYYIGDDNPVDQTDYDAWYASVLGGAKKISIPWQEFSPENYVSLR